MSALPLISKLAANHVRDWKLAECQPQRAVAIANNNYYYRDRNGVYAATYHHKCNSCFINLQLSGDINDDSDHIFSSFSFVFYHSDGVFDDIYSTKNNNYQQK